MFKPGLIFVIACAIAEAAGLGMARADDLEQSRGEPVSIRVHGAPDTASPDGMAQARIQSLTRFQAEHPWIQLSPNTGLEIEGRGGTMATLMQIAGDIAPDVLHVDLGIIDSFVEQGFLSPLDDYIARMTPEERMSRAPPAIWDAVTRAGPPDGREHVYALPIQVYVSAMFYRRGLFRQAGLPDRPPADWAELEHFCERIREKIGIPALGVPDGDAESRTLLNFMMGVGARVVERNEQGEWRCVFATPQAAAATVQYAKLLHKGWAQRDTAWRENFDNDQVAMIIQYVDSQVLTGRNPDQVGIGPLFDGPGGRSSSQIFCNMLGLFSGIKTDAQRDAAWQYMRWQNSGEDRRIQVDTLVRYGYGAFVNPSLLREYGHADYAELVPAAWQHTLDRGLSQGQPDVHAPKIDDVMRLLNKPLGDIVADRDIRAAVLGGDVARAETLALEHLRRAQDDMNQRLYGTLEPRVRHFRRTVATFTAGGVMLLFVGLTAWVLRAFRPPDAGEPRRGAWQFAQYRWAYLILLPAIGSVLLWQYYPLARGTIMAFQDYRVMGDSRFVGMDNFAQCLFDPQFWHSFWVSIQYAAMFMAMGFVAPIVLAIMLQETPIAKTLFRVVFYLPAILAGIVVVLLWKQFFDFDGVLNRVIGFVSFGAFQPVAWLNDRRTALLACILPTVWAGMGPGCLIYLAALKTIPEELYEAADMDGASIGQKIFSVTLPGIKGLIIINFVGAFIGAFRSAGMILAMTGGGPTGTYNATEVAGLHIYYTAFLSLKFGLATAMAWILGAMLIGFTMLQLRKLSRMEYRTTQPAGK